MAGIMDFLMGRGALNKAAQTGVPYAPPPVSNPAGIDVAGMAQQQANHQLGFAAPGMDIGNGPGGVQSVDASYVPAGPMLGAPGGPPVLPSGQSQGGLMGFLNKNGAKMGAMGQKMTQGQGQQMQAPPLQMAPSSGIGNMQPGQWRGLLMR